MSLDLERPLRNPDLDSPPLMTKRARWLVVLGFLLPGSAQLLAGNRKLGRVGLSATIILIVALLAALGGLLFARVATLSFFTNSFVLLALQILLIAYAVLWLVLGLNTLKLTRLSRVHRGWKLPIAMLAIILTLVPVTGAAWAASTINAGRVLLSGLFSGAPAVEPVDGRYNILLLGTDAGADREGMRPDSISLVSVDAKTGQSVIVGIPRELANAPFPEDSPMYELHPNGFGVAPNTYGEWGGCEVGRCILNGLFAETEYYYPELYPNAVSQGSSPGIEATKDAVTGATGLEVQFYVLVNMDAFESLINALGGITIDVKERLPIGGDEYGNNVEGWIEPGLQGMDGYAAQWYARSRYGSAAGDYSRMERQRELQAAILAQMNPSNVLLRFQDVAAAGTELVETDIPESMLGRFVDLAAKAREHTPLNVELVPPAVDPEDPDFATIWQLVADGVTAASEAGSQE
ncbi:LCP family protein [Leucobacter chromiireducens]|uniref:LytR family transcriptional regulator n=1 Tax=Leucobacter chromiireducens subsp. solipictus TaxID=398235 RepID=A0ABS1SKH8_9MICO|nr:LCP family protein [Leucobacter chromiireducens]MBL3679788.1 LytR family transcriptional regulator [Leucobacter chromiireducens subsp. solipictus]